MKSLREAAHKIAGDVQTISMLNLAQILHLSYPISLKAICNAADTRDVKKGAGGQPKTEPPKTVPPKISPTPLNMEVKLGWVAPFQGKMYVVGEIFPTANGVITKVKNTNTAIFGSYHLWFIGPGATSEDAFDPTKGYLLTSGSEATPAKLNLPASMDNTVTIKAVPSPVIPGPINPSSYVTVEVYYEIRK
jgi:hypothetical protein